MLLAPYQMHEPPVNNSMQENIIMHMDLNTEYRYCSTQNAKQFAVTWSENIATFCAFNEQTAALLSDQ